MRCSWSSIPTSTSAASRPTTRAAILKTRCALSAPCVTPAYTSTLGAECNEDRVCHSMVGDWRTRWRSTPETEAMRAVPKGCPLNLLSAQWRHSISPV
eukprot:7386564-Prymnesium_polylepis.1